MIAIGKRCKKTSRTLSRFSERYVVISPIEMQPRLREAIWIHKTEDNSLSGVTAPCYFSNYANALQIDKSRRISLSIPTSSISPYQAPYVDDADANAESDA